MQISGRYLIIVPYDSIWGIALQGNSPETKDLLKWRGQNLLGFALMEVRDELKQ